MFCRFELVELALAIPVTVCLSSGIELDGFGNGWRVHVDGRWV